VRDRIANSTIEDILTNRKKMREAIRNEIFEVVKGWGMWIETIEITDVKIMSEALFRDMQNKFREESKQKALLCQQAIRDETESKRLEVNLKYQARVADINMQKQL